MIKKVEHIGIAVKDLNSAIEFYEKVLGLKCYKIEEVEDQRVKTAFFKLGDTKIELLEGTADNSPITKFIAKKGEGIHHIAYLAEDIQTTLDEFKKKGLRLIDEHPRKGTEGFNIAFIHPASAGGVLIELCEESKKKS